MIKNVFDVAEKALTKTPLHVTINENKIDELADIMKEYDPNSFYGDREKNPNRIDIIKELVFDSINYCYWYGTCDIRPNNISSTHLLELINDVFKGVESHALNFESRINQLIYLLSYNRYPLLEERKRHLQELCENRKAETFVGYIMSKLNNGEELMDIMLGMFQGYSSDIFLKRASLFFIQLYRKYGLWKDNLINVLPVPADYQVPKILKYYGCLEYSTELETDISENVLIPKDSIKEIQIRAATIKVCNELKEKLNWNIADIDTYLWGSRKISNAPFHLTISTNY